MGSSTGDINPESRVPLIERMPTDDTTRSKEWTTRGNRIKPEASAIVNNVDYNPTVIKRNVEKGDSQFSSKPSTSVHQEGDLTQCHSTSQSEI
jgi:hypothetical protein